MRTVAALAVVTGLATLAGCGAAAGPAAPGPPPSAPTTAEAVAAPSPRPPPAASASAAARPSVTGADAPILLGQRRFVIKPADATGSILAVDASGRLNLADGGTDKGQFVLVPSGARHLIR